MADADSEEAKIDCPPHLPPELHLCILDYAYDSKHSLTDPISRALLPRYRQALYRSIRLTSPAALAKLAKTFDSNPSLGSHVRELDVSECYGKGTDEALEKILPRLPSLRSFAAARSIFQLEDLLDATLSETFPRLTSLSYKDWCFMEDDLEALANFNFLKRLEVGLEVHEGGGGPLSTAIDSVEALLLVNIQGAPLDVEIARFVDCFPNLTELSLFDDILPRYSELLLHLTQAPNTLTSLKVDSSRIFEHHDVACDHLFPRFQRLESLDLCELAISPSIPRYLRQLPNLKSLRLGRDTQYTDLSIADIRSLLEGPTRLVSFKTLLLDAVRGKIGRRVDVGDEAVFWDFDSLLKDGWKVPQFGTWKAEEIWQLRAVGEANEVEVGGSTFDALRFVGTSELEAANRVILDAYRDKTLESYNRWRDDEDFRLPILDADKLDPNNLKLVKLDLPEEGWFQLTLE